MHWKHRLPITASNEQVAAFAWLKSAAMTREKTLRLAAVH